MHALSGALFWAASIIRHAAILPRTTPGETVCLSLTAAAELESLAVSGNVYANNLGLRIEDRLTVSSGRKCLRLLNPQMRTLICM